MDYIDNIRLIHVLLHCKINKKIDFFFVKNGGVVTFSIQFQKKKAKK